MAKYIITPTAEHYDPSVKNRLGCPGAYVQSADLDARFTVRGKGIGEAAQTAARRIGGRNAVAERTTGNVGLSGMFQAYKPLRGGGLTSIGHPFHVRAEEKL